MLDVRMRDSTTERHNIYRDEVPIGLDLGLLYNGYSRPEAHGSLTRFHSAAEAQISRSPHGLL